MRWRMKLNVDIVEGKLPLVSSSGSSIDDSSEAAQEG